MSGRLAESDTIRRMDSEPTSGRARMLRSFRLAALVGVALVVCAAYVSTGSSLAVAVNGRIAFVLRSDLFTIRPDGSGLMRLTSGRDVDDEPAWSPGGRWLAFSRTSRDSKVTSVYLVGERGGKPRLLLRGARSPKWSPDGRRVAVVRSGRSCSRSCPRARDLWTVGSAGRDPRLALAGAWEGDWSPSGRELAAIRADGIWIVSVGSRAARQVSSVSDGGWLDWSPDGSRLLLEMNDGIVTVSLADGAVTTLVAREPRPAPGDPRTQCSGSLDHPAWSPDGRWIAYEEIRCVTDSGDPFLYSTISVISAGGNWHSELNNLVWGWTSDFGMSNFVWSPDSRRLAFLDDSVYSSGEVYLETAKISGTDYQRLKRGLESPVALAWQRSPGRDPRWITPSR